ncbi:hypothetical protein L3Q82_008244 [Scortum barcoo]|uniref:Uncharacterized protein n=1 Tax=Scortum barcoo TaxID=214431 RepID=A0ACB8WGQ8_9TELE|nr:hypothetical protein L3Q82_008244 [Scortum barcoo]
MMHYSNWLIGVKNRASLRNACKTPPGGDWNNRGNAAEVHNNNPQLNEKTSARSITTHLWRKGYKVIKKIGEGTFSEVVKTQSLKDGKFYACKTMKQTINSDKETGTVSLICELMEMNIYEFIQGREMPLPDHTVKNYMYQLCKSLEHMHSCGIFHRDVKPENILIKQNGLKLGDFGSCRSVYSKPPHTEYISTRWYRAPECLLTDGYYSLKMDMWSAGCVFFEIMSLSPLFPGTNELDQVAKIHDVLGTPDQSILQKFKQLAEKKAESLQRLSGSMDVVESSGTHNSLDHIWRPTRLGKQLRGRHTRQTPLLSHNMKHVTEPLIRRNIPHYPAELPKLNMVVPGPQISFPVSTMPAFTVTHRGTLPAITSKKCQSRLAKPRDESHRAAFKTFYMPPLDRKHGGY